MESLGAEARVQATAGGSDAFRKGVGSRSEVRRVPSLVQRASTHDGSGFLPMPYDETRVRAVLRMLLAFGEDPDAPELAELPGRVAEFWKERLAGYTTTSPPNCNPSRAIWPPCP